MSSDAGITGIYRAPALDKGLDVLECLAEGGAAMTQAQLARALVRGPGELFRILAALERRAYIARDPSSGAYRLTLRLYELGHAHSPFDALLRAAEGPMRRLTGSARESCHLSVIRRGALLVLHGEESPARVRISVEIGSTIGLRDSASGRVLLAHLPESRRGDALTSTVDGEWTDGRLPPRLAAIRERGYDEARGETVEGVSDLSVPVGAETSRTQAALAIIALPRVHEDFVRSALPALRACAAEIGAAAGIIGTDQRDGGDEGDV